MSQYYELKDGSLGHFDDAYKENVVEELTKMPILDLKNYIKELTENLDSNKVNKINTVFSSKKLSSRSIQKGLELVADIEYSQRFYSGSETRERAKELIKKYGREVW